MRSVGEAQFQISVNGPAKGELCLGHMEEEKLDATLDTYQIRQIWRVKDGQWHYSDGERSMSLYTLTKARR
jgi:hypothetical protein